MKKDLKNKIRRTIFFEVKKIFDYHFADELFFDIKDIENVLSEFGIKVYRKKGDPNSWLNQMIYEEYKIDNKKIYSIHEEVRCGLYEFPQKNKKYIKTKLEDAVPILNKFKLDDAIPEIKEAIDIISKETVLEIKEDDLDNIESDFETKTLTFVKCDQLVNNNEDFEKIVNELKDTFSGSFIEDIVTVWNKEAIIGSWEMYKEQTRKRQIKRPERYMYAILCNNFNKTIFKNRGEDE